VIRHEQNKRRVEKHPIPTLNKRTLAPTRREFCSPLMRISACLPAPPQTKPTPKAFVAARHRASIRDRKHFNPFAASSKSLKPHRP
jgi:hypothetical protein